MITREKAPHMLLSTVYQFQMHLRLPLPGISHGFTSAGNKLQYPDFYLTSPLKGWNSVVFWNLMENNQGPIPIEIKKCLLCKFLYYYILFIISYSVKWWMLFIYRLFWPVPLWSWGTRLWISAQSPLRESNPTFFSNTPSFFGGIFTQFVLPVLNIGYF